MRKYFIIFAVVLVLAGVVVWAISRDAGDPSGANRWHLIQVGTMASVEAEMTLYESLTERHFFIHLRVRNTTDRIIAADLRKYMTVIYPNQWGALDQARRGNIDEVRIRKDPLDDVRRAELLKDFKASRLTSIAPGETIDYYREFNASTRADVEKQTAQHPFMFISLDGQQLLTDGVAAERISCDWERAKSGPATDMIFSCPIRWKTIPFGGHTVVDR